MARAISHGMSDRRCAKCGHVAVRTTAARRGVHSVLPRGPEYRYKCMRCGHEFRLEAPFNLGAAFVLGIAILVGGFTIPSRPEEQGTAPLIGMFLALNAFGQVAYQLYKHSKYPGVSGGRRRPDDTGDLKEDSAVPSQDGPQLAGSRCCHCAQKIVVQSDGMICDLCREPMHEDCQEAHAVAHHEPSMGSTYRENAKPGTPRQKT